VHKLEDWVDNFGIPEMTWDLAWLIIVFSESGIESVQSRVPEMVDRLVDAQLREGPGKGLWGPLAVNPDRLAYRLQLFIDAGADYAEVKDKYEDTSSRTEREKFNAILKNLDEAREGVKQYTLFFETARPDQDKVNRMDEDEKWNKFYKPDEYVFHTRTADLSHTWLALYSIRIASENSLVTGPKPAPVNQPGKRMAPSFLHPRDAVLNAGRAVAAYQHPSGAFTETNIHQPVHALEVRIRSGIQIK
jgi:hypothetical protein